MQLTRLDTSPVEYEDELTPEMKDWLVNLTDELNYDLDLLEASGSLVDTAPFILEAPFVGLPNSFVLQAGFGITLTVAPGTITVASTGGGFTWHEVTTPTQTIANENGYIANNGGGVTFTLPITAAVGDEFSIVGKAGGWVIAQLAGQSLQVGNVTSTMGIGGSVGSSDPTDSVVFVCITANTKWATVGGPQSLGLNIV